MDTYWVPRFVYTGTDWTPDLPQRPWAYRTPTVGGSRTAASGTPASYVVRRDSLLAVTLRIWETELADLQALVAWGQASETITFYPDTDTGTSYACYLESPLAGEELAPQRNDQVPQILEVSLVLRSQGAAFALEYFPDVNPEL